MWMARKFPAVPFERYVDDAVVHCATERQARMVLPAIGERMEEVGLRLHPDKTRIVYCQDGIRRGSAEHTSFTYLGYTFRAGHARPGRGRCSPGSARDQQGRPEENQCRGAVLAAAPAHLTPSASSRGGLIPSCGAG